LIVNSNTKANKKEKIGGPQNFDTPI